MFSSLIFFSNIRLFAIRFRPSKCAATFCSYKKLAIFTTNVHTKHTLQIYEKLSYEALNRQFFVGAVSGWAFLSFVSNISCLVELADILHFRNCNKHNSRLAVVLKRSYNFHIRKNIGMRLSASFLPFCVRSLGK